jgi:thiamine pyrophosphate-dependent acetolactate synthase large subunit-like protein
VPHTVAAQWAHPGRQCLAFVGDGCFAMLMAEFLTAMRYSAPVEAAMANALAWQGPALVDVVVGRSRGRTS